MPLPSIQNNSLAYVKYHPFLSPRLKPCFTSPSMSARSYLPGALLEKNRTYAALFHRTESRLKVSRAQGANYPDGPSWLHGRGLPLDEKGVRPNPPPPFPQRTPLPPIAVCFAKLNYCTVHDAYLKKCALQTSISARRKCLRGTTCRATVINSAMNCHNSIVCGKSNKPSTHKYVVQTVIAVRLISLHFGQE